MTNILQRMFKLVDGLDDIGTFSKFIHSHTFEMITDLFSDCYVCLVFLYCLLSQAKRRSFKFRNDITARIQLAIPKFSRDLGRASNFNQSII